MKTAELTGVALDWAVAKCEGATEEWRSDAPFLWDGVPCIRMDGHDVNYRPSTSWLIAGPIIERENISITGTAFSWWCCDAGWYAHFDDGGTSLETHGDTPLIAAMRCYVTSKLGDEVDVPEEFLTKGETA